MDHTASIVSFSCTVVLKPYDSQEEVQDSHTFSRLTLHRRFFLSRSGSQSIHISTLLAAIKDHQAACNHQQLSPTFQSIFQSERLNPTHLQSFDVATSRVPDFEQNIRNPMNGYRFLGNLAALQFQYIILNDNTHTSEEVLAIGSPRSTLPVVSAFLAIWDFASINLDSHFILILQSSRNTIRLSQGITGDSLLSPSQLLSPPQIFHQNMPQPRHSLLLASSLTSMTSPSSAAGTPFSQHSDSLSPLEVSTSGYRLQSVSVSPPQAGLNHINMDAYQLPQPQQVEVPALQNATIHQSPPSTDTPSAPAHWILFDEEGVEAMLQLCSVTMEEKAAAYFVNRPRTFFAMLLNFYSLRSVLLKLGCEDILTCPRTAFGITKTEISPLVKAIQFFRWNLYSVGHKAEWFKFAIDVTRANWCGSKTNGMY